MALLNSNSKNETKKRPLKKLQQKKQPLKKPLQKTAKKETVAAETE